MSTNASALAVAIAMAVLAAGASAQDLEPRSYVNTPVGMNFLLTGYGYAAGGVATDPSLPIANAKLRTQTTLLAYARSLDVFGLSGKLDAILPYAWLSGSADFMGQPRERRVSGFGDARFRFSTNFYGAPAMTMAEYQNYKQDVIIGGSIQVTAPLGQYDSDKAVNIGSHRWAIKPELGISKALGPLALEIAPAITFYTDNDDFLGKTRAQDPIYSVQGHLSYSILPGLWAALDATYYAGGRTTLDGVGGDDLQQNSRVGATIALPVNRHASVKLYASTGVSTRTGASFDAAGIILQYRWGGGL